MPLVNRWNQLVLVSSVLPSSPARLASKSSNYFDIRSVFYSGTNIGVHLYIGQLVVSSLSSTDSVGQKADN